MIDRTLALVRFDTDPGHRPPAAARWVLATALAIGGSLAADAVLVAIGTAVFPSTRGYEHFRFGDYATLTVIGVVVACVGWPVVVRLCAAPRALFAAAAVAVTLVLLLPDVVILERGQPGRAVAVLMVMHVAIAVVTYAALVVLAPPRAGRVRRARAGSVPA